MKTTKTITPENIVTTCSAQLNKMIEVIIGRTPDAGTPKFSSDLNAIAAAVDTMVKRHGTIFLVSFNGKLERLFGHHDHLEHELIHASARKRAEAFILACTEI